MSHSKSELKQKLEGYKVVKDFTKLIPGDRIKYMVNNELRGGGAIKLIKHPTYLVCINPINKVTWSVQLTEPTLKMWVRSLAEIKKENDEMRKIYKLYKEGKLIKIK